MAVGAELLVPRDATGAPAVAQLLQVLEGSNLLDNQSLGEKVQYPLSPAGTAGRASMSALHWSDWPFESNAP